MHVYGLWEHEELHRAALAPESGTSEGCDVFTAPPCNLREDAQLHLLKS